jgi:hypothetical protein
MHFGRCGRAGRSDQSLAICSLALALFATSCRGKSEAPPCTTVASQFFVIATGDLAKATVDPATSRAVTDQLPAMRDALATVCKDGAWSAAVRTCMAAATDHAGLQACEVQLTDDQRRGLDRAARSEASTP